MSVGDLAQLVEQAAAQAHIALATQPDGQPSRRCSLLSAALAGAGSAHGAASAEQAAASLEGVAHQLRAGPPGQLYANASGVPDALPAELQAAGAEYVSATALLMQLAATLVPAAAPALGSLPAPEASEAPAGGDDQLPARLGGRPSSRHAPLPAFGIMEVTEEAGGAAAGEQAAEAAASPRALAVRLVGALVAACATHGAAAGSCSACAGEAHDQPGVGGCSSGRHHAGCELLPAPAAPAAGGAGATPSEGDAWVDGACEAACEALLCQLAACVAVDPPPPAPLLSPRTRDDLAGGSGRAHGRAGGAAANGVDGGSVPAVGRLLAAALPLLLAGMRDTLFAQRRHELAQERGEPGAYAGPGPYARTLCARQLAWLAARLPAGQLAAAAPGLLPLALAASDDPCPAVRRGGHRALLQLAARVPASLAMQRALLAETARRLVVGCEAAGAASAYPAAGAIALALDGADDPRGPVLHSVLEELATEGERGGHQAGVRAALLACLPPLLDAAGLQALRHLSRLLPLLLEWLRGFDAAGRLAALAALRRLLAGCWPRLPAHAALVWAHLEAAAAAEEGAEEGRQRRRHDAEAALGGGEAEDSGSQQALGAMLSGAPASDAQAAALRAEMRALAALLGCCGGPGMQAALRAGEAAACSQQGSGLVSELAAVAAQAAGTDGVAAATAGVEAATGGAAASTPKVPPGLHCM